jgi:xanthine dehydrogenase YagS FAD-binding subunit
VKAFAYVNPTNEKDAVAALAPEFEKALPIGGGQDLLARMKDYVTQPDRLVNVKGLDATVTTAGGGLKIGAAMRLVDLADHAQVKQMYPAIARAAIEVGTPQIRHQGTVGGNLNQRPRCWYFRNEEFVCFKKGGNTCFSPAGENQFHAIFGNGPSFIVHPSSLAVPAVAYGATFRVLGPAGERMVPAADYFTMPTLQNVRSENVLAPNEILTHVLLPAPGSVKSGHYCGAGALALAGRRAGARGQARERADGERGRRRRGARRPADESKRLQGPGGQDGREARDSRRGRHQDGLNRFSSDGSEPWKP